jgi:hypothetical protein
MEAKKTQTTKAILNKKNNAGGITCFQITTKITNCNKNMELMPVIPAT